MVPNATSVEAEVSPFYIASTSTATARRSHVLKQGDSFAVLDQYGDIQADGPAPEGLFFEDTRYLSRLVLSIDQLRPLLFPPPSAYRRFRRGPQGLTDARADWRRQRP